MRVWINGKLVPARRAVVSAFDRGFLYGDGVYETLRAYEGVPFHLMEHYARLRRSCAGLGIRCPFSLEGFRRALVATLRANRLKDAVLRLTVSRGPGPVRLNPAGFHHPTAVILPRPVPSPATRARVRVRGVSAAIVGVRRNSREALDPQIKSSNFLNNILAL
ncbi:MAG: aminotransferase class IV, partial [bacterium]